MSKHTSSNPRPISDYLGISSATICLIHCLATPILMSMGVAVHEHEGHEHGWMLLLSHGWDFLFLGIGFAAVLWSSMRAASTSKKVLLWASYAFLVGAILMEHWGPLFQYLTYFASLLLISAHASNIKAILSGKHNDKFVCASDEC
ncbi:MAG: MerC domain-containing protein [Bacteroidia bacterium]|nr:MerC domain-containing protein [Bacteroidia bacterium]